MKNILDSPVSTLYFLSFISGANTYNDAIKFIEVNFEKDIKISNFSKVANILIDEGYLEIINNPSNERFAQKKLAVVKKKVVDDILEKLTKNVTDRFTYSFVLDGRRITKRKKFTYDKLCNQFDSYEILFDLFSNYCKNVIINSREENITKTSYEYNYYNLILKFIYGIAMDDEFYDEFSDYLGEDEIVIPVDLMKKKLREENKELKLFTKICKQYVHITNIDKFSVVAKASLRYQD